MVIMEMIRIIKNNRLRQTICSRCFSKLEYDHINDSYCDDIQYNSKLKTSVYSWYINCPQCGHKLKVEEKYSK